MRSCSAWLDYAPIKCSSLHPTVEGEISAPELKRYTAVSDGLRNIAVESQDVDECQYGREIHEICDQQYADESRQSRRDGAGTREC